MPKNRNIGLMYAMALLQGMVFYGPVATLYRRAAGVSLGQIALMESVSLALAMALELPWGVLADRIGYRRTLVLCSVLYFVSKLIFWQARGFGGFLLERVLLSVVLAGLSGVDTGFLYLSCPPEKAQRVFGVYNNMTTAGLLLASGVYTLWVGENYRLAGLLTAVSYGLAGLLALGLREVPREAREERPAAGAFHEALRGLFRDRRLLPFLVGVALVNEVHQMVTVFLNQPQYVRAGMSGREMGAVYIAVTLCGLLGGFSARLTGRIGAGRALALLFAVPLAGCLVLARTASPVLSVVSIAALRVSFSLLQPLQTQFQNRAVTGPDRAAALSANALLMDSVGAAVNLALGRAADGSLSGAFLLSAGLCLGALVLLWRSEVVK